MHFVGQSHTANMPNNDPSNGYSAECAICHLSFRSKKSLAAHQRSHRIPSINHTGGTKGNSRKPHVKRKNIPKLCECITIPTISIPFLLLCKLPSKIILILVSICDAWLRGSYNHNLIQIALWFIFRLSKFIHSYRHNVLGLSEGKAHTTQSP